ncbi:unnamed protein product [Coccothraustes coccothraustes]
MQGLRKGEDAYLELSGAKGRSRTVFSRSRALESTGTGTMLSGRRSLFFASTSRRARPLLRREERSRRTLAFSARTHQGQYLSSRLPFDHTERFLWREVLHNVAAHFARPPATLDCKSQSRQGLFLIVRKLEKLLAKMQALRKAEDANLELKELRAGPELFQQEPRFGEHGHRHNAQCVKKPRLRFHQPESAASAET